MNTPDHEFWTNLGKLQILHEKLGLLLKYSDQEGIPIDLNHVSQTEIESFKNWSTKVEDNILAMLTIAETNTTYPEMMEENLSEEENELLPDEGNPGFPIGA